MKLIMQMKILIQKKTVVLNKFDKFFVKKGTAHQITNPFEEECHFIEIAIW